MMVHPKNACTTLTAVMCSLWLESLTMSTKSSFATTQCAHYGQLMEFIRWNLFASQIHNVHLHCKLMPLPHLFFWNMIIGMFFSFSVRTALTLSEIIFIGCKIFSLKSLFLPTRNIPLRLLLMHVFTCVITFRVEIPCLFKKKIQPAPCTPVVSCKVSEAPLNS